MEKVKLGDVFTIKKGKKTIETSSGKYNYITIENLHSKVYNLKTNDSGTQVSESDIIIAWDGANAGLVGTKFNGIIGSTLAQLKLNLSFKNKVETYYVFRFLDSKFEHIKSKRTGATIPHVNGVELKKIQIPLPDLATQRSIAARLDKADEVRRYNQQLIEKYDELTQSLFLDMFGDPVKNEKGWEVVSLEECLDFLTSGSRGWAKYYSEKGDIFLRIQNIGYSQLKLDELNYINTPNTAEARRTKVKPNDVILSITADLGRTAVIPEKFPDAYINQHLAILRLNSNFNPFFVSAYISTKGGQLLFGKMDKGGVKAGLNFADIKSYKIFSVHSSLQNEFAERVQAIEAQKQLAQETLEKSEALFQSLLKESFS